MTNIRMGIAAGLMLLLLSNNNLLAQTGTAGQEIKRATVNFSELARYYKEHPEAVIKRNPLNEEEEADEKPKHRAAHGASVHLFTQGATGTRNAEGPHSAYLPVSPAPNDSFQSSASDGSSFPPDTHGAVDSQYCVTAINTNVRVQTRAGADVTNIDLNGFWSAVLPAGLTTFDPRVHYDPLFNRWILVTDAVNYATMTSSTVLVAVSATNDPTGVWNQYAIAVDATGASWMDFPNVGYNKKWITVTGNMFANTGAGIGGAIVFVFNYASIMAGTGAPYTRFLESSSFAIAPALTHDTTEPNQFALESWNGGAGQLKLWKISGAVSSPTIASIGFPASATHWAGGPLGGDFAPQVGGTDFVNTGDDRITNVVYRNQTLWCSQTAFLPAGSPNRSSIMWWQIDTLANPIQNGLVDDPSATNFYGFSTLAVNANNDALLGFANFSATIHPSAAYALHLSADPLSSMHPPIIYRHGLAYYYASDGSRNRWGDFSGTCVDPRNDTDFWTIQETSMVGGSPNWDTWWANVQFCPKPLAPVITSAPAVLCGGDSGTYYIAPITGATSYQWMVSGAGWTGASTTDSIVLTAGVVNGTITVLAYNSCGEGESNTFNIIPGSVPTTPPVITTITPACEGAATAVFAASSAGITSYFWQAIGTGWAGTSYSSSLTATIGSGTGTIICVGANSCGTGPADTFTVIPAVIPTSNFTIANPITNVSTNDIVTYTGVAPAGCAYTWTFGGGSATPGGTVAGPQTVSWTIPGLKTLSLIVTNAGCPSTLYTDTVLVIDNTGVQQAAHRNVSINIVPNPNDGSFDILFDKAVNESVMVKLADMQGRIVYNNEFSGTANNKLQVITSGLPSGIYTVTMYIAGVPTTEKVTIAR